MEWRRIPGWPMYEVSEFGDVRRCEPGRSANGMAGRVLRQSTTDKGYRVAFLYGGDGIRCAFGVHVLVALAFIGPKPTERHQAAHWDNDKANNHWRNIRWATPRENCADRVRHGVDAAGDRHPRRVLSSADVIEIRAIYAAHRGGKHIKRGMLAELAQRFGVGKGAITAAVRGDSWARL